MDETKRKPTPPSAPSASVTISAPPDNRGWRYRSEAEAMAALFRRRTGIDVAPREVAGLPYLLDLIRAHPRGLMDSADNRAAVAAMRTLRRVLPGLQGEAEGLAREAAAEGLSSWLDRYAANVTTLMAALEPFNVNRRDHRAWWHGWAHMAVVDVRLVLSHHGKPAGIGHPTSPTVLIVADLLALAGVRGTTPEEAVTPEAVVEALRTPRAAGDSRAKLPACNGRRGR